jgi:hypothetical protein
MTSPVPRFCLRRGGLRVRRSIDDFDALGVHEYQRVTVRLPRREETELYFRSRRVNPPFVWIELGRDVQR